MSFTASTLRTVSIVLFSFILLGLIAGCSPHQPDVIKIGLVAPFEGLKRYLGIDAIYAARLAVREINNDGGINGIPLELVAYDDQASMDMAADIVRNLATDPQVVAVVGHYYDLPIEILQLYEQYGLPLVQIDTPPVTIASNNAYIYSLAMNANDMVLPELEDQIDLVDYAVLMETQLISTSDERAVDVCALTLYPQPQDVPGTSDWVDSYQATGPHVPAPGAMAMMTYDAIRAIAQTLNDHQAYSRSDTIAVLPSVDYMGYLGHIIWDEGYWQNPTVYLYCLQNDELTLIQSVP